MSVFTPGWNPGHAELADAALARMGVRKLVFAPVAAPRRQAYSLTRYRVGRLEQGSVGTCHEHAAARHAQVWLKAHRGVDVAPCRNLIGYAGCQIMSPGHNPCNGGSPTCNLRGMSDGRGGLGIADESAWPYRDDCRSTGGEPTRAALDSGKSRHFLGSSLVSPAPTFEAIATLIDNDMGVCNGVWWAYSLDSQGGTIFDGVGGGTFGHALYICGYAVAGVLHAEPVLQLDNWHGLLYRPLSADQAAKVEGYAPIQADRTADFWITWSAYSTLLRHSGDAAEHVTITDADGVRKLTLADAFLAGW